MDQSKTKKAKSVETVVVHTTKLFQDRTTSDDKYLERMISQPIKKKQICLQLGQTETGRKPGRTARNLQKDKGKPSHPINRTAAGQTGAVKSETNRKP